MNYSPLKNDTFLRALLKQPTPYTPVWMMRQAGRYLPEYRALRAQAGDFLTLCKTPELACEVTLQPLRRFDLDAAILFSDILTIPDAMGLGLYFDAGEGPKFKHPLRSQADITALRKLTIDVDLKYVLEATKLIRETLNGQVPLIGFSGSPWTLATYMVEGGSSKDFRNIKRMLYETPDLLHALLEKLATAVTDYLNGQILAGAQAVQLFDTWGGVLTPENYQHFSLAYMTKIINGLIKEREGRKVPVILFTKNAGLWLETMADSGADALGLDWCINIADARRRVGDRVALQGNMDPSVLYSDAKTIRATVKNLLEKYGTGSGHVFNLGHGISQDVNPEHAKIFIDAVHEFSAAYH